MIKKITRFLNNFFFKEVSGIGLSVFRIFYHLVFFAEVATIYNYRQLYFDEIPFLKASFPDLKFLFILWFLVIGFQIFGYRFRLFSIFNYVFTLVFISSAVSFEYHIFYIYTGINFLFLFLPANNYFSIDYIIKKKELANQGIMYILPKVSKINYLVPVFLAVGLTYFDSVIYHKLRSDVWMSGLGLWVPSSLPQLITSDSQWILNNKILVRILSYITLSFEFIFIFLFFFKKFRFPLFIIGVGLHFGILLAYPIPYFALGFLSIYILLIPVSYLEKMKTYVFFKIQKTPFLEKFIQAYNHFFKINQLKKSKKIIKESIFFYSKKNHIRNWFFVLFVVFTIIAERQVYHNFFSKSKSNYEVNVFLRKYFGITTHELFVESHYNGYNNIYSLKYKGEFLPLFNEKGMPDKYISGGVFANWVFRVNGPYVVPQNYYLQKGLKNYSAFWIKSNDLKGSRSVTFDIVRKKIKVALEWEKDLLKNNISSPWEKVGSLTWSGGKAKINWIKSKTK